MRLVSIRKNSKGHSVNDPANKGNGYLDISDALDKLYFKVCNIYCAVLGKTHEEIGEKEILDMLTVSILIFSDLINFLQDIEARAMDLI